MAFTFVQFYVKYSPRVRESASVAGKGGKLLSRKLPFQMPKSDVPDTSAFVLERLKSRGSPVRGQNTGDELKMAVIPRRPHISRGIRTKLPRLVIAYR